MNLYIRLIRVIIKCFFAGRITLEQSSKISFRVMPWDCDFNFHMTNSRYNAFMDLARTYFIAETNLLKKFLQKKWIPVLAAAELSYFRAIKPFAKFRVESTFLGCDEKYIYMKQCFYSKNTLCAYALVKAVIRCKNANVPTKDVIQLSDFSDKDTSVPEIIRQWQQLNVYKRQD